MQTAAWGYLTYLINDTLTSSQLATVKVLAEKCPDWDGDAVYEARALMSIYDSAGTVYSDSCYAPGSHKAAKQQNPINTASAIQIQNATVNLYPNPNNGNFTLEYDLGNNVDGKVILYDMYGQLVGEYSLANSQGKMSISNPQLSNGVYIWKLYTNTQSEQFGKVIIMK